MKRLTLILCIITFSIILGACRSVNLSSASEVTSLCWKAENLNFVSATLEFETQLNKAILKISDEEGKSTIIEGTFAIDKDTLYITSDDLYKTYSFGYKVFKDRLLLTYNGCELTFSAIKEKEP